MPDLHDYGTGEAPQPPRSFPKDHRPQGWTVDPTTLDDLMQRAGPYADAAKAYVEWSAVTSWMMKGDANAALAAAFIPGAAANLSVFLASKAIEHEAGWPSLSDNPVPPALYDLPEDAQQIARRMAAEVHALWEAAGRPHLTPDCFKDAYAYLIACIRKGAIPPVKSIGEVLPRLDPPPHPFFSRFQG